MNIKPKLRDRLAAAARNQQPAPSAPAPLSAPAVMAPPEKRSPAADVITKALRHRLRTPLIGLDMLIDQRHRFKAAPVDYDLAIARLAITANVPERAVPLLAEAIAARRAAGPDSGALAMQRLERSMGDLLMAAGRIDDAAVHFNRSLEDGGKLAALDVWSRMALLDHADTGQETAVPRDEIWRSVVTTFSVYDTGHRVHLVYVPKNACSALKATVIMNSPARHRYDMGRQLIHAFVHSESEKDETISAVTDPTVFRFAVLREPAKRLISAYLDKIVIRKKTKPLERQEVERQRAIFAAQKHAGLEPDLERSITFEEFVRYLMTVHDLEMNHHWLPQVRIVGRDLGYYTHVGKLEKLNDTYAILREKFGYVPETDMAPHLGHTHSNVYSAKVIAPNPHRMLPHELKALDAYPSGDRFYTDELRALVRERYADDYKLYEAV